MKILQAERKAAVFSEDQRIEIYYIKTEASFWNTGPKLDMQSNPP